MGRFFAGVAFLLLLTSLFMPHSPRATSASVVTSQAYGGGDGRVYAISAACSDGASSPTISVAVPKSRWR